jgi:RHS repeat-associated protein
MVRSENNQYQTEYRYGADGQRAVKYTESNSSQTLYFNDNMFVTLTRDSWIENKNIFLGDTRIVTKRRNRGNPNFAQERNQQYYYHGDHLGNVQLVTDSAGDIYEHFEYTPYGEIFVDDKNTTSTTLFRFTGKQLDDETGLLYFGARYLNPQTSMWLSADPAMGEYVPGAGKGADGLPGMGGVYNSINMHVFAYAGNNPVNLIDPTGMWLDNGDGTHTAESGDTLWDLYGADWQAKSGYTGDPRNLQIGETVGQQAESETNNSTSTKSLFSNSSVFGNAYPLGNDPIIEIGTMVTRITAYAQVDWDKAEVSIWALSTNGRTEDVSAITKASVLGNGFTYDSALLEVSGANIYSANYL